MATMVKPAITIEYCTQCRWMLRASWLLQELLTSFDAQVSQIALKPGQGGVFRVLVDEAVVWDRPQDGALPELRVLKQRIRDLIAPDMVLGHTDRVADPSKQREAQLEQESERSSEVKPND